MFRTAIIALAFAATPALASSHYVAKPASPAEARIVIKDILWKCGDDGCAATKSNSRPAVVCSALVKKVGALRSFSVAGVPLSSEDLEKCNAKAS
ncbi:MAG: hypothetical protein H0W74_10720 [Sphingosinicella sp.]|nr:hypothetical protein [Sphingosinicella sp.]